MTSRALLWAFFRTAYFAGSTSVNSEDGWLKLMDPVLYHGLEWFRGSKPDRTIKLQHASTWNTFL